MSSSEREGEIKLNIGCGTSVAEGWVNIDNSPTVLLSRLPFGRQVFRTPDWPRSVRRMDVRKRIAFSGGRSREL
jgi:hypothetical protein